MALPIEFVLHSIFLHKCRDEGLVHYIVAVIPKNSNDLL